MFYNFQNFIRLIWQPRGLVAADNMPHGAAVLGQEHQEPASLCQRDLPHAERRGQQLASCTQPAFSFSCSFSNRAPSLFPLPLPSPLLLFFPPLFSLFFSNFLSRSLVLQVEAPKTAKDIQRQVSMASGKKGERRRSSFANFGRELARFEHLKKKKNKSKKKTNQ